MRRVFLLTIAFFAALSVAQVAPAHAQATQSCLDILKKILTAPESQTLWIGKSSDGRQTSASALDVTKKTGRPLLVEFVKKDCPNCILSYSQIKADTCQTDEATPLADVVYVTAWDANANHPSFGTQASDAATASFKEIKDNLNSHSSIAVIPKDGVNEFQDSGCIPESYPAYFMLNQDGTVQTTATTKLAENHNAEKMWVRDISNTLAYGTNSSLHASSTCSTINSGYVIKQDHIVIGGSHSSCSSSGCSDRPSHAGFGGN